LFVICSALVWWMETIGDWGQELIYSPRLDHYHTGWLPYTTPNDPYFMPFTYAVYWTVHAWAVLTLAGWLARRRGWSLLRAVLVLSVPVGVIWDLTVESTSAYFGWWTYNPGFGPEIHFARGNQPLLWPMILMCIWPNFVAYVAGKPKTRGLNVIERRFGLGRFVRPAPDLPARGEGARLSSAAAWSPSGVTLAEAPARLPDTRAAAAGYEVIGPRWRFELARFGAWMVTFQVSFFVILCIPLVTLRLVTGHNSIFVP
jgi:hypothetical protein